MVNTPRQVLLASLVGTTIEYFDFYIYATAAVLVFPQLFFPPSDPATATLASLATFGIAFVARLGREGKVSVPIVVVFRDHFPTLVRGTFVSLATFVVFYLTTVFALSWGTTVLGYSRESFLRIQLVGIVYFGLTVPLSAVLAERGRRIALLWVTAGIAAFGLIMAPLLSSGLGGATAMMIIGLGLMGLSYGPLGTVLSELFPTHVRDTGSSLTFNLAGIFGASLAPYIATWLAQTYGLEYVGYYLSGAAALTIAGLLAIREIKDQSL